MYSIKIGEDILGMTSGRVRLGNVNIPFLDSFLIRKCGRDIYYAKYYGKGGGMVSWGKNLN